MEVILLERVENLGHIGDVVRVKQGFARNFLLPQKKALRATDANRKVFEAQRAQIEARNDEARSEAETVAAKVEGATFVVIRQASDTGHLYGSVSTRDIADKANEAGYSVSRTQVRLDKPLKTLGIFQVKINLHPEVLTNVSVNIARSQDEAERQARGEDVLAREIDEPQETLEEDSALGAPSDEPNEAAEENSEGEDADKSA